MPMADTAAIAWKASESSPHYVRERERMIEGERRLFKHKFHLADEMLCSITAVAPLDPARSCVA